MSYLFSCQLWKTRWLIFRKASSKGPLRIDSYKDERASALSDEAKKVIKLNSVRSIAMLPPDVKRNAIGIVFHEERPYYLALDTSEFFHQLNVWRMSDRCNIFFLIVINITRRGQSGNYSNWYLILILISDVATTGACAPSNTLVNEKIKHSLIILTINFLSREEMHKLGEKWKAL